MAESAWVLEVIQWRRLFDDHGLTPNGGGVLDQSAWLMEAIEVLSAEIAALKSEKPRK